MKSDETKPAGSEPKAEAGSDERQDRAPAFSNALGNLILLLILVCLISIPFLVYFTDMGARVKREMAETMREMEGPPPSAVDSRALEEARAKIEELENRIAVMEAEDLVQPEAEPASGTSSEAAPADIPLTPDTLPRREYDVAQLFNGVGVKTTLNLERGELATRERVNPDAYQFQVQLNLRVPEPNRSAAELAALNPHLPEALPGLDAMLATAEVSPLFKRLYDLKHERIKASLTRLDRLETRHNYFDCETMLDLEHPETGRHVVLVQGEMDVVADGSDGDRLPTIDDYISLSTYYQPTTSYGWSKKTSAPNPLLERLENELEEVVEEYAIKGLSAERNRYLRDRRDDLKRMISDLKVRSYLVAEADPFVVLPLSFLRARGERVPDIGDYAVVIHGNDVYPAICGDAGPSWKFGEASLFMARTINERASPYNRPVSDLKVTYLLFPGSAEERKDAPDLELWTSRCRQLLDELGGLGEGFELHRWRDIIAEREAVRYTKSLVGGMARHAAEAVGAVADIEQVLSQTEGKLAKAKEAAAAGDASGVEPAEAAIAEVQAALDRAEAARDRIDAQAKPVSAAAEKAVRASGKSYPTPWEETTRVALEARAEADEAADEAAQEAQAALEAVARARKAVQS